MSPRRSGGRTGRFGASRRRGGAAAQVQGRWSLTSAPLLRRRASIRVFGAGRWPSCCSSATASSPASRCWPRASPAASRRSTPSCPQLETLGVARRGYFLEGLGGAQFALPGAVERLRARPAPDPQARAAGARRRRSRAALWGGAAVARARRSEEPAGAAGAGGRAYVVLSAGDPVGVPRARRARAADARAARRRRGSSPRWRRWWTSPRRGRLKRVALEKVDGEPAMSSPLAPALLGARVPGGPAPADADAPDGGAMPEGDTIAYAARRMRPVLEGLRPRRDPHPHPRHAMDRWPRAPRRARGDGDPTHGKHLFLSSTGELVDPLTPADDRNLGGVRAGRGAGAALPAGVAGARARRGGGGAVRRAGAGAADREPAAV